MTYYKKYVNIIIQQDSNYLINERYVHMTKTFFKIITVLLLNVLVVTYVKDILLYDNKYLWIGTSNL